MIQRFNESEKSDGAKNLMKRLWNDSVMNEWYRITDQQESQTRDQSAEWQ